MLTTTNDESHEECKREIAYIVYKKIDPRKICAYIKPNGQRCKNHEKEEGEDYCDIHRQKIENPTCKRAGSDARRATMQKLYEKRNMKLKFWETRFHLPRARELLGSTKLVPSIKDDVIDLDAWECDTRHEYTTDRKQRSFKSESGREFNLGMDGTAIVSDELFAQKLLRCYINHNRPTSDFVADDEDAADAITCGELVKTTGSNWCWKDKKTGDTYRVAKWLTACDKDEARLNQSKA